MLQINGLECHKSRFTGVDRSSIRFGFARKSEYGITERSADCWKRVIKTEGFAGESKGPSRGAPALAKPVAAVCDRRFIGSRHGEPEIPQMTGILAFRWRDQSRQSGGDIQDPRGESFAPRIGSDARRAPLQASHLPTSGPRDCFASPRISSATPSALSAPPRFVSAEPDTASPLPQHPYAPLPRLRFPNNQ